MEKTQKALEEHMQNYSVCLDALFVAIDADEHTKEAITSYMKSSFWAGVEAGISEGHAK